MRDGLLTRDDARPGQKAAYSLTEQAIQLVPVFAQSEPGDVDTALATDTLRVRSTVSDSAAAM